MSTDLEIPFSRDFVSENIYVIKFELLSIPSNNTSVPLYSTSQLLITTKLLNDKYGTVANFNNLEFGDWITEYKNYINARRIEKIKYYINICNNNTKKRTFVLFF